MLIYYPTATLSTYLHAIYIPIIAATRDDLPRRSQVSDDLGGLTLLLGLAMMIGFAVLAPTLAPLIFGHRFAQAAILVGLIGALQIARFLLSWPTTVALAIGRSRTVLLANIAHVAAVPMAFLGLWFMGGLIGLVEGFLVGEVLANVVALALLNRAMNRPPSRGFDRLAEFLVGCGAIVGWNWVIRSHSEIAGVAALAGSVGAIVWLGRREARALRSVWSLMERLTGAKRGRSHATS